MSWTMPRGSRLVVVEPHADDAFLSLGSTLERLRGAGVRIDLVTVLGNARRNTEAARYAAAIGADHIALGYRESDCGLTGPEPESMPWGDALDLRREVRRIAGVSTPIAWPLGLQHPEHRAVAAAGDLDSSSAGIRYVDQPYGRKVKNATELAERLDGREYLQADGKDPAVWRHVPLFKSQSMFFYYNPADRLQALPETIVTAGGSRP